MHIKIENVMEVCKLSSLNIIGTPQKYNEYNILTLTLIFTLTPTLLLPLLLFLLLLLILLLLLLFL